MVFSRLLCANLVKGTLFAECEGLDPQSEWRQFMMLLLPPPKINVFLLTYRDTFFFFLLLPLHVGVLTKGFGDL